MQSTPTYRFGSQQLSLGARDVVQQGNRIGRCFGGRYWSFKSDRCAECQSFGAMPRRGKSLIGGLSPEGPMQRVLSVVDARLGGIGRQRPPASSALRRCCMGWHATEFTVCRDARFQTLIVPRAARRRLQIRQNGLRSCGASFRSVAADRSRGHSLREQKGDRINSKRSPMPGWRNWQTHGT